MFVLVAARFVVNRRVAQLEKKYIRAADAADHLLAETIAKDGGRVEQPLTIAGVPVQKRTMVKEVRPDAAQMAKRHYLLGLVVQKRDRLEEKHLAWERRADKLNALVERVRAWKGRKLPYTLGVLDVSTLMYLIDRYGLGEYLNYERLLELANNYVAQF
jgi:hypothetical protein